MKKVDDCEGKEEKLGWFFGVAILVVHLSFVVVLLALLSGSTGRAFNFDWRAYLVLLLPIFYVIFTFTLIANCIGENIKAIKWFLIAIFGMNITLEIMVEALYIIIEQF